MDRERLVKRLMTTFLEELEEHIRALNRDLLELEKGKATAECVRSLFRTAHSLKGAARSVNVSVIEDVCHQMEDVLSGARDDGKALTPEQIKLLFTAADTVEEAGMRLREEHGSEEPASGGRQPPVEANNRGLTPPTRPLEAEAPPPSIGPAEAATVRVTAEKLDALLARSGELLAGRRRMQARMDELGTLREFVGRWKAEWQAVEKALGRHRRSATAVPGLPRRATATLARAGENLRQLDRDLERIDQTLVADRRVLDQAAGALDEEVRRARMLPFAEGCHGLERLVRDLSRAGGKDVDLHVEGGEVELDRSVLESLKDALRHLIRNAVDHGIEPTTERQAAGKPPRGRLTVSAVLRGSQVEVVVADDGRGLDLEALRRQCRKRGLPEPADERELAGLVFLPGLSTAPLITDVSGRGVGLDVVKNRVETLHGTVTVDFTPGHGTRFTLAVPLTLTTLRVLFVTTAGQTFAFISTNVRKLVRLKRDALRSVEGREMFALDGAPVPVVSLAATLGLAASAAAPVGDTVPAVVVMTGTQRLAFLVDELLAEQEVVIKSLGARVRRLLHVSGATILPSSRVALVLNAADLARTARSAARVRGAAKPAPAAPARKRILIAEDSVTTRTLQKSILETAGYEVLTAPDGDRAWQMLQERGADLLLSDIDMPGLDGFALTQALRGAARFTALPVVLMTSRGSDQDRTRGIEVGADAYLIKSGFSQTTLLETIAQLL